LTAARIYRWLPADLLATNRFDSSSKIARIRQPVVLFHSGNDRLIPLQAARDLYTRITATKWMVETAGGHNGAGFADENALREALWRFWPAADAAAIEHAAGTN
jgi:hypothetical protein